MTMKGTLTGCLLHIHILSLPYQGFLKNPGACWPKVALTWFFNIVLSRKHDIHMCVQISIFMQYCLIALSIKIMHSMTFAVPSF